jgi:hypothetical protein
MNLIIDLEELNHATGGGGLGTYSSSSLSTLWPASFDRFACLNFGHCPLFLFLSFSWVLSFYYQGWPGFINKLVVFAPYMLGKS